MGHRSLFHRKAASAQAGPPPNSAVHEEPVTPEALQDLESAWAELTEAAKGSRFLCMHQASTCCLGRRNLD